MSATYVHFVFAETPTENNPTPLKGAGVTAMFDEMVANDGDTLITVPSLAARTAHWGFWQGVPRRFLNVETLQFEEEDTSLWTPTYLMHYIDGEYVVQPTEPPCIAWMTVGATVSASLTIS